MKLRSKIVAGILIACGLLGSVDLMEDLLNPEASAEDKEEAPAGLVLTLGFVATGAWMFWRGHQQFRQQERNRLRTIFFRVLQENNGYISTLRFAMEAELEGQLAKAYLDECAKEFNAEYNISEAGNMVYHFDLDVSQRQFPDSI